MMKRQMKRTVYEAPVTERFQVELEGAFMAASVVDEEQKGASVETTAQEYTEYDMSGFAASNWE